MFLGHVSGAAMHAHHLWIVSKCCSASHGSRAAFSQGGRDHFASHCECISWSTPGQVETSAPGGGLILRTKGGNASLLPQPVGYWVCHQLMSPALPPGLRVVGSKSGPLCASGLRTWMGTGMSCVFRMEQFPMDRTASVSNSC